MNDPRKIAPYGSWASPITADQIAKSAIGLGPIALDAQDVYWSEMRPAEGGRNVIVRWRDGIAQDILPAPFNARTRVHEYGGGSFAVADGELFFSNDVDQRLYRLAVGGVPQALTPESERRYADCAVDRRHNRILCVCEDHGAGGAPVNTIVAIGRDACDAPRVLVSGHDFYASPRLSPDGARFAWLAWNHPDMPWDGTELWLAELAPDGSLTNKRRVAGSRDESIFQPVFSSDGALYFISDRSNWWNLYRLQHGQVEAIAPMEAEFGLPQWIFGMSTYAMESERRLVVAINREGTWGLATLATDPLRLESIATPFTDISAVAVGHGKAFFVGAAPALPPAVVQLDLTSKQLAILRASNRTPPDSGYLSEPRSLAYPVADGEVAHAFYYPPANRDFSAPVGEKPPLLVQGHGGPTSAASSALNLKIQYWTSRGFAVLDVNYRGSTGYGRDYRHKLDGQWGVADVEDCLAGARYLVTRDLADVERLVIRGGSAGGYTALCALTFHDVFRAGTAYYGVSDPEALARDTHKFEAHYLDRLIGPYPSRRELYRERSPIHHVDRLACPVIFFQGLEDKVVPPDQTEKMVVALRVKGIPVAYVPFAGESHGFRRGENIQRALEAELYFYSRLFQFAPADAIAPVTIANL